MCKEGTCLYGKRDFIGKRDDRSSGSCNSCCSSKSCVFGSVKKESCGGATNNPRHEIKVSADSTCTKD